LAIFAAIRRASSGFDPNQSLDLPTVFQMGTGGGLVMHLWHDSLSSKDLLEACVVFAMGLTFVIAFRWKKSQGTV
jgi:hypothetical protein